MYNPQEPVRQPYEQQYEQPYPQPPQQSYYPRHPQYQEGYRRPDNPPSPGKSKTQIIVGIIIIIIILAIIAIAVIFIPGGEEDGEREYDEGYTLDMNNENEMTYHFEGEISGVEASNLREFIDEDFGNGDDKVTQEEVNAYIKSAQEAGKGEFFDFVDNDNWVGKISDYSLSLNGATGDIDSEDVIYAKQTIKITWNEIDTDENTHRIVIKPYSASANDQENFIFNSPQGYTITEVDGLNNEKYNSDRTQITGKLDAGDNYIVITIEKESVSDWDGKVPTCMLKLLTRDELTSTATDNLTMLSHKSGDRVKWADMRLFISNDGDVFYVIEFGEADPNLDVLMTKGPNIGDATLFEVGESIFFKESGGNWDSLDDFYLKIVHTPSKSTILDAKIDLS